MTRPFSIKDALHRDPALSIVLEKIGANYYFAVIPVRATTPIILNVSTTNGNWTPIATGLTGVLAWTLVEENGNDFRYAFTAAPSTYINGFGWVSNNTGLTGIHVQRPGASNIDMQLLYWTI